MRRGTTATLTFILPKEISIAALYITFEQKGRTVLEKTLDDVTLNGREIKLRLAQQDTLYFEEKQAVHIQLRIRDTEGNAVASDIIRTDAREILKEGVI